MFPIRNTAQLDWALILLIVGLGATMVIAGWFLLTRWGRRRAQLLTVVVASVVILASMPLFVHLQRYSGLGILAFRGARYWVHRAAAAHTPEEEQQYLWFVLTSSNYGVNAVESAVLSLPDPAVRHRLFQTLARITPIENWRATYQKDADDARQEVGGR